MPSATIQASYDLASVSNPITRPPQVLDFSLTKYISLPSFPTTHPGSYPWRLSVFQGPEIKR